MPDTMVEQHLPETVLLFGQTAMPRGTNRARRSSQGDFQRPVGLRRGRRGEYSRAPHSRDHRTLSRALDRDEGSTAKRIPIDCFPPPFVATSKRLLYIKQSTKITVQIRFKFRLKRPAAANLLKLLARPKRFELLTPRFLVSILIQTGASYPTPECDNGELYNCYVLHFGRRGLSWRTQTQIFAKAQPPF